MRLILATFELFSALVGVLSLAGCQPLPAAPPAGVSVIREEVITPEDEKRLAPLTIEEFEALQAELKALKESQKPVEPGDSPSANSDESASSAGQDDCCCQGKCTCQNCDCGPECCEPMAASGFESFTGLAILVTDWCVNCKPIEKQAESLEGVLIVDVEKEPELAAKLWGGVPLPVWNPNTRRNEIRTTPSGAPAAVPCFVQVVNGEPTGNRWGARNGPPYLEGMRDAPYENAPPMAAASGKSPYVLVHVGGTAGSGVVIESNGETSKILTASHVIQAGWPWSVDGKEARLIGVSTESLEEDGLALLEIDGGDYAAVSVAANCPDGSTAVSRGYPGGREPMLTRRFTMDHRLGNTISNGAFNASVRFVPGESGSGVTNNAGELVGIVSGTDHRAGVGIVIDHQNITSFLGSELVAGRGAQLSPNDSGKHQQGTPVPRPTANKIASVQHR